MSDFITDNKKGVAAYRIGIAICSVITTALAGIISSYVISANTKLDTTASDVAQIKWELPVIKERAVSDKAEILKQISAIESRLQTIRELGDGDRKEIYDLKTGVALLKQKLQLP